MYTREKNREYQRKWYQLNKEVHKARVRVENTRIRERNREFIRAAKDKPCMDCGQSFHFSQMDFDHVLPGKINPVSMMSATASIETLQAEIDKCELVCANCHRLRTWSRSQTV